MIINIINPQTNAKALAKVGNKFLIFNLCNLPGFLIVHDYK